MASDALKFGDAMRSPSGSVGEGEHWATTVRRVAVRSPRWAFPPRLPGGPTAAGSFLRFELLGRSLRWWCLPADSATPTQIRIREPIGSSPCESSMRAGWVYGEPAMCCGGFDGRAVFPRHELGIESG